MPIDTHSTATAGENVYVAAYDMTSIDAKIPHWSQLSFPDRLRVCSDVLEPVAEDWSYNTTTIGLDEYRALNLDATRDVVDRPAEIALGDGGTTPAHGNRELNNELGRTSIGEYDVDGGQIVLNAYLPREQLTDDGSGNTPTLQELGIVSEAGRLFNHSLFSAVEKTAQRALQLQVTLTFDTA